jgi:N-acylglucosamine 2-epimerase
MILLNVIDELCSVAPAFKSKYTDKLEWCVQKATAHIWEERKVVLESVSLEGKPQLDSPEGRVLNPGHAIEAGWFLWQHALGEVK